MNWLVDLLAKPCGHWPVGVALVLIVLGLLWIQACLMQARYEARLKRWLEWRADEQGSASVKDFQEYLKAKK